MINCFKVFPYNRLFTLIQSLALVCLIYNLLKYSFVTKIAILVNRAVELVSIIPTHGLINDKVLDGFAEPQPMKISVILNNTFF